MGTLSCFCNSRPKKYPTAEKLGEVCGEDSSHLPVTSAAGACAGFFLTVKRRMLGLVEESMAAWASRADLSWNSMFDCPEQIHTSPNRTFLYVIDEGPETVSSNGPPSLAGSSLIIHFPSAPAVTCLVCPAMVTVIDWLGAAVPQIGVAKLRWRTMLSEKMAGRCRACGASAARRVGWRNVSERMRTERRRNTRRVIWALL